jgi:hypothetical protein
MTGEQREKGPDEVFCTSCGSAIKKRAEICPECGVRNDGSTSSASSGGVNGTKSTAHDPRQYQTTVSGTWWYGVAAGTGLWILVFAMAGALGDSLGAFGGFLALVAWIGLPAAAYFDMQYVRANSRWNPNTVIWVLLLAVWVVNIVAGGVYLYRRHEVLGEP